MTTQPNKIDPEKAREAAHVADEFVRYAHRLREALVSVPTAEGRSLGPALYQAKTSLGELGCLLVQLARFVGYFAGRAETDE